MLWKRLVAGSAFLLLAGGVAVSGAPEVIFDSGPIPPFGVGVAGLDTTGDEQVDTLAMYSDANGNGQWDPGEEMRTRPARLLRPVPDRIPGNVVIKPPTRG